MIEMEHPETVIASEAKQSILPLRGEMDCFAALAMTSRHTFTTSPRHAPEALMNLPPKEGVGNAGCPLHPRPRVHLVVVERTRVTTSTPESPDVPARNGFNGFLRALPGDRALLPPSPCGLKVLSSPVEPNEPPQDLTPASRRQDHTTSPSASSAVVLHAANRSRRAIRPALASHAQHCCVHRTPPRVRDDHDTPLWWGGMATVLDVIWVGWQQISFGKSEIKDSTTPSTNRPTGKSTELRCGERTVSNETIPPLARVRTRRGVLHAASRR